MMAAAMTTRNSRAPTYVDLAKSQAVLTRELAPSACPRLRAVVLQLETVQAELRFGFDAEQRIQVTGSAEAEVEMACQLCSEPVRRHLSVEVEGLLAPTEEMADAWREAEGADNIVVVSTEELDAAELVEDELLLQLPSQVCTDADCENRPQLSYAPPQAHVPDEAEKPFAALSSLKAAMQAQSKLEDQG